MLHSMSPIVIGGTGGSGTRVIQTIVEKAGVFMGEFLNSSKDAMDFEPFLDEIINPILQATHSLNYNVADLPLSLREKAMSQLAKIANDFVAAAPSEASSWGWKNPRTIYILPLIHAIFPNMRFIHVLRDGRDMALSSNQNQLRKHYSSLFGRDCQMTSQESIQLWAKANSEIQEWAFQHLDQNYHWISFEQLCQYPETVISELVKKLQISNKTSHDLRTIVAAPDSIGRFQTLPETAKLELTEIAFLALKRFHYLD